LLESPKRDNIAFCHLETSRRKAGICGPGQSVTRGAVKSQGHHGRLCQRGYSRRFPQPATPRLDTTGMMPPCLCRC